MRDSGMSLGSSSVEMIVDDFPRPRKSLDNCMDSLYLSRSNQMIHRLYSCMILSKCSFLRVAPNKGIHDTKRLIFIAEKTSSTKTSSSDFNPKM